MEITKHAEERYTERLMDYSDKQDIATYIAQNKDLIAERITKMVNYGELIYEGKIRDGNYVKVILKDNWVVLLDRKGDKVITLYKICLIKNDDEFNKLFVAKMKEKISDIKSSQTKTKEQTSKKKQSYLDSINENKQRIKEYETLILELRKSNAAHQDEIDHMDAEVNCIDLELKHAVEDLVATKLF